MLLTVNNVKCRRLTACKSWRAYKKTKVCGLKEYLRFVMKSTFLEITSFNNAPSDPKQYELSSPSIDELLR